MTSINSLETEMKNISPLLIDLINSGQAVKMTVTGNSMYPFLRHLKDSVLLVHPSQCPIKKGRIVLVCRPDGRYILHRIVKLRDGCFWMLGDAQTEMEGPYSVDCIIAAAQIIFRNKKNISFDAIPIRFALFLWQLLKPARRTLLQFIWLLARGRKKLYYLLKHC